MAGTRWTRTPSRWPQHSTKRLSHHRSRTLFVIHALVHSSSSSTLPPQLRLSAKLRGRIGSVDLLGSFLAPLTASRPVKHFACRTSQLDKDGEPSSTIEPAGVDDLGGGRCDCDTPPNDADAVCRGVYRDKDNHDHNNNEALIPSSFCPRTARPRFTRLERIPAGREAYTPRTTEADI